jgi:hypothetical protein
MNFSNREILCKAKECAEKGLDAMVETKEKFTFEVTDTGLDIFSGGERVLHFTAGEALMLLDILQNEEANLKRIADEASPIPISINV